MIEYRLGESVNAAPNFRLHLALPCHCLQNGTVAHQGSCAGTGPSCADGRVILLVLVMMQMRRILILVQALTAFESASALATSSATPASTQDSAPATCQTDRPDPYICECLGLNGCWEPSEPGDGPPYMHDGNWPKRSKTCSVKACNDPNGDDSPSILEAFADCKEDGHIIFEVSSTSIGAYCFVIAKYSLTEHHLLRWKGNEHNWAEGRGYRSQGNSALEPRY